MRPLGLGHWPYLLLLNGRADRIFYTVCDARSYHGCAAHSRLEIEHHAICGCDLVLSSAQAISYLRQRKLGEVATSLNNLLACEKAQPSDRPVSWDPKAELQDLYSSYLTRVRHCCPSTRTWQKSAIRAGILLRGMLGC